MWEGIKSFFTFISNFITGLWDELKDFFMTALVTMQDMIKDVFFWVFETLMDFGIYVLNSVSGILEFDFNPGQYITALPPEVVEIIGVIRLGECMAIIVGAIVIKVTLQMIPFTRLGS